MPAVMEAVKRNLVQAEGAFVPWGSLSPEWEAELGRLYAGHASRGMEFADLMPAEASWNSLRIRIRSNRRAQCGTRNLD